MNRSLIQTLEFLDAAALEAGRSMADSFEGKTLEDLAPLCVAASVVLPMLWMIVRARRPWASGFQVAGDWLTWIAGAALWLELAAVLWRRADLGLLGGGVVSLWATLAVGHTLRNFAYRYAEVDVTVVRADIDPWDDFAECACWSVDRARCAARVPHAEARVGSRITVRLRQSLLTGKYFGRGEYLEAAPRLAHRNTGAP